MNNLFLETLGTNTFVEYRIEADDELDTMSLGMLTNNNIPGLASASFAQMDLDRFIKYNVSAKVSVKQLFSGPVNKKRLLGVFSGILDAMIAAEDYMLDPSSLVLDLDYIFSDVSTCETVMICLPLLRTEVAPPDLGLFFKNIVFTTQFDQTENCDHVAQILNYLNSNPILSLPDFKQLLDKLADANNSKKTVAKSTTEQTHVAQTTNTAKAVVGAQPVVPSGNAESSSVGREQTSHTLKNESVQATVNAGQKQVQPVQADVAASPDAVQTEAQKPMSMFYLLQHYNKENAAAYKAQKAAKKGKKPNGTAQTKTSGQQAKPATQAGVGYAVPGAVTSYAVPNQPQTAAPVQPGVSQPEKKGVQPVVKAEPVSPPQQHRQTTQPANFGETTVLGGSIGETTVLGASMEPTKADPHLIRSKNNEKIPLNKPVFRIGKERSYVDYFISDNTAISRGHANIVDHNGEFYIVDTNSTNHTYVNGAMIQSGVETKLSHGDKVRLANEDFEFRLY